MADSLVARLRRLRDTFHRLADRETSEIAAVVEPVRDRSALIDRVVRMRELFESMSRELDFLRHEYRITLAANEHFIEENRSLREQMKVGKKRIEKLEARLEMAREEQRELNRRLEYFRSAATGFSPEVCHHVAIDEELACPVGCGLHKCPDCGRQMESHGPTTRFVRLAAGKHARRRSNSPQDPSYSPFRDRIE